MKREVVLLNGWGMTRTAWQPLTGALPAEWTLHAIDLQELGCGTAAALAGAVAERSPRSCDVVRTATSASGIVPSASVTTSQRRRLRGGGARIGATGAVTLGID